MQPNYKLKAVVINEGDDKLVKKYDFLDYSKTDFLQGLDIEEAYQHLYTLLHSLIYPRPQ